AVIVHGRLEVVAGGAVDLKGHIVGQRLGVGRRPLRMRSGERVGRDLLEQARRGRTTYVGHVHLYSDRAWVRRRGRDGALQRAGLLRPAEARLAVGEHVWEAGAD